jgi:uncharacterized membrane protein
MTHKLKAMALALAAVLAISALAAASAQATFKSNKSHTIVHGTQEGSAHFTAGKGFTAMSCSVVELAGTSAGFEVESLVATPSFSGCKDNLGHTVHVMSNSLAYTLTSDGIAHASGSMVLTTTLETGHCTVTIKSQTNNGAAHDNLGGTEGIRSTISSTNVVSTTEGGFFMCGVPNGTHTEGTVSGTILITGRDTEENPAEISIE